MSNAYYGYAGRSGHAGAIWHYKHVVHDDRNTRAGTAGATKYNRYVGAPGNTVPFGTAGGNTCLTGVMS